MSVFTKQQRIAELAKRSPQMGFTSLAYLMDIDWLREAFHRTRKDGAPGVDGQTWTEYAKNLEANLQSLLDRAKSGTYRAPPVRRVHIPKAGSNTETRPIGIPTLEDKVLQRAVVMLLEPIYEQDFDAGSYGFRPGRSPHQALNDLWQRTMDSRGGWILEVDIRKFFDTLDHAHLREFLQLRVRDGVLKRLIGKWLKAGVMEDGNVSYPESGSPQGGVISPLLANVYLHYVLDMWFRQEVQPRLKGKAHLIRYADDFVILFVREDDARRVMEVLPKRFGRYGLTLHPDKTRLVPFRRPPHRAPGKGHDRGQRPGTFDRPGRWLPLRAVRVEADPRFAGTTDTRYQGACPTDPKEESVLEVDVPRDGDYLINMLVGAANRPSGPCKVRPSGQAVATCPAVPAGRYDSWAVVARSEHRCIQIAFLGDFRLAALGAAPLLYDNEDFLFRRTWWLTPGWQPDQRLLNQ